MSRWTKVLTRAEWVRLAGFGAAVLALHLVGWGLFLYYARRNPALAGLGTLAYTFGLRHAFDADHIAAIDNTTRKLLQDGKRSMGVGFFFSLGHSTVVFVARRGPRARHEDGQLEDPRLPERRRLHRRLRLGHVPAAHRPAQPRRAARHPRRLPPDEARASTTSRSSRRRCQSQGLMSRFFLKRVGDRIDASWKMYPLGILFGLGFDTATEIGLLAIAAGVATHNVPFLAVVSLPLIFAAGMSLMDTADGAFMSQAYGWAFSNPIRKVYYNITVTSLSVAVALIIGTIELLQVIAAKFSLDGRLLGLPRQPELRQHRLRRRRPVRRHLGVLGDPLEERAASRSAGAAWSNVVDNSTTKTASTTQGRSI